MLGAEIMDRMLSMRGNCRLWVAVASLVISQAPNRTAYAADEDVAAFYRGKTIRMVVGTSPGGGVDLIGRLVAKHLRDHIPGNPSIVVQNMPGAGGMQMTNNLFNTGARDGTVIGAPVNGVPTGPLLQPRAARFDPTKLLWIGSVYRSTNIAYAWHTAPVQSLDQWKTQELLIGTSGVGGGSYDVGVLTKDVLGLKTKLVRGYESTPQVNIAMERGEIHAQIVGWESLKAQRPAWVHDRSIITILGHFSLEDPPELRPFARIVDLAKTEADRQALRLVLARQSYGRPYFLPPEVPPERVEALRRAFDATMNDPAFREGARQMEIDVDPMNGEDVQA